MSKSRYSEQIQTEKGDSEETKKPTQKSKDLSKTEDHIDELKDEPEEKEASVVGDDEVQELKRITKKEKKEKKQGKREKKKLTPEERKAQKALKRKKRAKIIVRNVPFKVNNFILKNKVKKSFYKFCTMLIVCLIVFFFRSRRRKKISKNSSLHMVLLKTFKFQKNQMAKSLVIVLCSSKK